MSGSIDINPVLSLTLNRLYILAFALLAKRKLVEEDAEQRIRNLEDLLENNPYPNSIFITELGKILDLEKEALRESQYNRDREDQNPEYYVQ